jgi:hypothetical protein
VTDSQAQTPATAGPAGSGTDTSHAAGTGAGGHGVNVEQLADKVYKLLLADVRLGRARGDSTLPPRRKGEG